METDLKHNQVPIGVIYYVHHLKKSFADKLMRLWLATIYCGNRRSDLAWEETSTGGSRAAIHVGVGQDCTAACMRAIRASDFARTARHCLWKTMILAADLQNAGMVMIAGSIIPDAATIWSGFRQSGSSARSRFRFGARSEQGAAHSD